MALTITRLYDRTLEDGRCWFCWRGIHGVPKSGVICDFCVYDYMEKQGYTDNNADLYGWKTKAIGEAVDMYRNTAYVDTMSCVEFMQKMGVINANS